MNTAIRAFILFLCSSLATAAQAGEVGDLIRAHNAAFAERDLDAFVSAYNENAVVMVDGQTVARGTDEIRELYAADFRTRVFDVAIRSFKEEPYFVTVEEAMIFRGGRTVCCATAEYEIFNGKIAVARLTVPEGMR